MRNATSPMMTVESLQLDLAYVEIAKTLGLPAQAYMAFSDSKFTDAQAGAETFSSALLAALAGVNSVSGPGMLDYLLVFSLEKLVFDNEVCGQALHFVRPVDRKGDLPAMDLARQLMAEGHLLTSPHTLDRWQQEMYLPGMIVDRLNRDTWSKSGAWDLTRRAKDEVDRRLAAYEPVVTDSRAILELERMILGGMEKQTRLPEVPAAEKPKPAEPETGRTRKFKRGG
jgi:trimethylamine--corrinoid protein Co-methyltransferase